MATKQTPSTENAKASDQPIVTGVPPIDDAKLSELAGRFKPACRFDGELWLIQPVDHRSVAFTWDPVKQARVGRVVEVATIATTHSCSFHGFFKPSVAEVLAQVTDEILKSDAYCFETVVPKHDSWREVTSDCGGYHFAKTTFYRASR